MPDALVNGVRLYYEDARALATIDKPTLLVAAADSPPAQRQMTEAMAGVLPNARTVLTDGGHLIDPASPEVLSFIADVLGGAGASN